MLKIGESETTIMPQLKAFKLNKSKTSVKVAIVEFKNIRKRIQSEDPYSTYCEMSYTKINKIIEVFSSIGDFKKANTNLYLQSNKHWKHEILKILEDK